MVPFKIYTRASVNLHPFMLTLSSRFLFTLYIKAILNIPLRFCTFLHNVIFCQFLKNLCLAPAESRSQFVVRVVFYNVVSCVYVCCSIMKTLSNLECSRPLACPFPIMTVTIYDWIHKGECYIYKSFFFFSVMNTHKLFIQTNGMGCPRIRPIFVFFFNVVFQNFCCWKTVQQA